MSDHARFTIIVSAAVADTCRSIAGQLSPGGIDMWKSPLVPSDSTDETATHYVSSGPFDPQFAICLVNAAALVQAAQAAGVQLTVSAAQDLIEQIIVIPLPGSNRPTWWAAEWLPIDGLTAVHYSGFRFAVPPEAT